MDIKKALAQIENSKHEFSKPTALAIETLVRHYLDSIKTSKEVKSK